MLIHPSLRFEKCLVILFFVVVIPLAGLQAQIKWESTLTDLHPLLQDHGAIAEFNFQNVGKTPITISTIKASCNCITVLVNKKTFQPKETGTVTAQFEFGRRTGLQEHQIAVATDDPKNPVSVLRLRTMISSPLTITPASLFWSVGDPVAFKAIQLKVETTAPIQVTKVSSDGTRFVSELKAKTPGREYAITVVPKDTATPVREIISVETDDPSGKPRIYKIEAIVGKLVLPPGLSEKYPTPTKP